MQEHLQAARADIAHLQGMLLQFLQQQQRSPPPPPGPLPAPRQHLRSAGCGSDAGRTCKGGAADARGLPAAEASGGNLGGTSVTAGADDESSVGSLGGWRSMNCEAASPQDASRAASPPSSPPRPPQQAGDGSGGGSGGSGLADALRVSDGIASEDAQAVWQDESAEVSRRVITHEPQELCQHFLVARAPLSVVHADVRLCPHVWDDHSCEGGLLLAHTGLHGLTSFPVPPPPKSATIARGPTQMQLPYGRLLSAGLGECGIPSGWPSNHAGRPFVGGRAMKIYPPYRETAIGINSGISTRCELSDHSDNFAIFRQE